MASVIKRRKSPYWVACYSLPDGSRLQRSAKTKDKSKAIQIAIAAERASRNKITSEAAREIISELVERIHGKAVSHESCGVYFAGWMERRRRELAWTTLDRFKDVFKSLAGFLGVGWEGPLSDLSPALVADWRNELAGRYAPVTVNTYLKVLKQALRDAWIDGKISVSPAEKIQMLKIPKGARGKQVFTSEQYFALIAASAGEWTGIIHAGAFTGQRLSDIASMRVEDVDGDWWRFRSRKTGAEMAIPLASPFREWYRVWISGRKIASAQVFPVSQATLQKAKGKPGALSARFHRLMVAAGLAAERDHKGGKGVGRAGRRESSELSFHSFRHTCTTWLKAQGEPESVAMAFVGHESKAVNRSYTHLPESALLSAMRKIEKFAA